MADNELTKKIPVVPHHEVRETFAEHIGLIISDGSTLKIDFEVVRMGEPASATPPERQRHVVARLALSMGCAIDLINQMKRLAEQMTQSGLIKTTEQGQIMPRAIPGKSGI